MSVRHDVTVTFMCCWTDKMYQCDSLQTLILYNLPEHVLKFNCGQAVMKAELHCKPESLLGRKAGSCSHVCWTSTANALFVTLLYFRAVLLLERLSDIIFMNRQNWLFYCNQFCSMRVLSFTLSLSHFYDFYCSYITIGHESCIFLLFSITSQCLHWWLSTAIMPMFSFKQTTSPI